MSDPVTTANVNEAFAATLMSKKKEFDALVQTIEHASKHARNVLSALVVGSAYVLLAAATSKGDEQLTLPVLNVRVPTQQFVALSPAVILVIFLYMHIYVADLLRRLATVSRIQAKCHFVASPRLLLYPWLLVFSSYRETTPVGLTEHSSAGERVAASRQRRRRPIVSLVATALIWCLAPAVLFSLWTNFVGREEIVSIIPCIAMIIAMIVGTCTLFQGAPRWWNICLAVGSCTLFVITIVSVPELRTFVYAEQIWDRNNCNDK